MLAVVAFDVELAAVVYDLLEASVAADQSLGLILVTNQPLEYLELDPRSQSRIGYCTIELLPYTKADLVAILRQRVEEAFHPDAVTDDAIDRIAASVAAQSGNCREALTLLRRVGRLAEQQHADRVTATHVEQCTSRAR